MRLRGAQDLCFAFSSGAKGAGERFSRRRAGRCGFGKRRHDEVGDGGRNVRALGDERRRRIITMFAHQLGHVALERRCARQRLVDDDAQAVNIRARVERFAAALFGRHIKRRAHNRADARQPISRCRLRRLALSLRVMS